MAGMSTYLRNKVLDAIFNNTSLAVANVYVSLHGSDCGVNGANEIEAGAYSYARKALSMDAAADGELDNDAEVEWENLPAGTIAYFGFWDADVSGNFLWGGQLTASRSLQAGDAARFKVGELVAGVSA